MEYDARGRLAEVSEGEGEGWQVAARYDYDEGGMRVLKRVLSPDGGWAVVTRFVYDGVNLAAERIERARCTAGVCAPHEREERRYV